MQATCTGTEISPLGGNRLLEVVIDDTFPKYMQERRGPATGTGGQENEALQAVRGQ